MREGQLYIRLTEVRGVWTLWGAVTACEKSGNGYEQRKLQFNVACETLNNFELLGKVRGVVTFDLVGGRGSR